MRDLVGVGASFQSSSPPLRRTLRDPGARATGADARRQVPAASVPVLPRCPPVRARKRWVRRFVGPGSIVAAAVGSASDPTERGEGGR